MLEAISWKQYGLVMGVAIGLYYGWWLVKYAPTLGWRRRSKVTKPGENGKAVAGKMLVMAMVAMGLALGVTAQDGNTGINQANTMVRSYFDTGVNLMYAVGAILGLIGAVKVYQKWSHGDHDTGKVAAAWFGACIFLVVVATVIRSFFGL
jgi:hypothetical protein